MAANIAEGYNRGSLREYIQYLNIARGSLSETEYYAIFAADTGLIDAVTAQELHALIDETGSLLLGLLRSLQAKNGGPDARMVREELASYDDPLPGDRDPRPATRDPSPQETAR